MQGERELVKIVSKNPAHPNGYYTQFRDRMKPDDVEYFEGQAEPDIQVDPDNPSVETVKRRGKNR